MTRGRIVLLAIAMGVALVAGSSAPGGTAPWGFVALNIAALAFALWVALPSVGGAASLLVFASPIVWWIDKPTWTVVTFSLAAVAVLLIRERPWAALAFAGAAAALHLPVALAGHSVRVPSIAELVAVPFDPAVGLAANFPVFVIVIGAALVFCVARARSAWRRPDVLATAAAGIVLLFTVAQATDVHGQSPSLSRYGSWLIPLGLPLLREAHGFGGATWRRFLWTPAGVSAALCAFMFHPAVKEHGREPTLAAMTLWTRHPAWNDPLPEVFSEVLNGVDGLSAPISTAGCEKVLVIGREDGAAFPAPCFPQALPAECAPPGTLCYANLDGRAYQFVRAPGSVAERQGIAYQSRRAWPAASVPHVRELLTQGEWWTLHPKTTGLDALRQVSNVRAIELEGDRRLVFVLRHSEPEAHIILRPPWRATGTLVDGMSGQFLRDLRFDDAPFARWEIDLPPDHELLLLSLKAL